MALFCRALKSDFHVPSATTLTRKVENLYTKTVQQVQEAIKKWPGCALYMDGWQDPQRCEVVGVAAGYIGSGMKPLLVHYERLSARPTTDTLYTLIVVCPHSVHYCLLPVQRV
jgi:hypothetical protein